MHDSKKGFIPITHVVSRSKDKFPNTTEEIESMKTTPYASAVESIMYVMLCAKLDIYIVVGIVNIDQYNLGREHYT